MINNTIGLIVSNLWIISYGQLIHTPLTLLGLEIDSYDFLRKKSLELLKFIFENVFSNKTFIHSSSVNNLKKLKKSKDKIDVVIANHFSTIDFVIIFYILGLIKKSRFSIIMKKEILLYPGVGIIICSNENIHVNRKWTKDKKILSEGLDKVNEGIILIFPEGTRYCKSTFDESLKFAKENNLIPYENLVFPRVKGLYTIVNQLKNKNKLGNIYDMTIIIPYMLKHKLEREYDMINLLNSDLKTTLVRIDIRNPPKNLDNYKAFKSWLYSVWREKDQFMNNHQKEIFVNINDTVKTKTNYSTILFTLAIIFLYLYIFYKKPKYMIALFIVSFLIGAKKFSEK